MGVIRVSHRTMLHEVVASCARSWAVDSANRLEWRVQELMSWFSPDHIRCQHLSDVLDTYEDVVDYFAILWSDVWGVWICPVLGDVHSGKGYVLLNPNGTEDWLSLMDRLEDEVWSADETEGKGEFELKVMFHEMLSDVLATPEESGEFSWLPTWVGRLQPGDLRVPQWFDVEDMVIYRYGDDPSDLMHVNLKYRVGCVVYLRSEIRGLLDLGRIVGSSVVRDVVDQLGFLLPWGENYCRRV